MLESRGEPYCLLTADPLSLGAVLPDGTRGLHQGWVPELDVVSVDLHSSALMSSFVESRVMEDYAF